MDIFKRHKLVFWVISLLSLAHASIEARLNHIWRPKGLNIELHEQLLDSCRSGDLKKVKELHKKGVNLECEKAIYHTPTPFSREGCTAEFYTPLRIACKHQHTEIIKYLLKNGANPETAAFMKYGSSRTILEEAVISGYINIVRCLVENGAKINNGNNESPALLLALFNFNKEKSEEYLKIAKYLQKQGASFKDFEATLCCIFRRKVKTSLKSEMARLGSEEQLILKQKNLDSMRN